MIATHNGHSDVVRCLIDQGLNPLDYSSCDKFTASAFDMAIIHDRVEILIYFISLINLNHFKEEKPSHSTVTNNPLHLAIELENLLCLHTLLDAGYPVDSTDYWPLKNTPFLDSNQAKFSLNKEKNGLNGQLYKITGLTLAVDTRNFEAVTLLLQNGANPDGLPGEIPPLCCSRFNLSHEFQAIGFNLN